MRRQGVCHACGVARKRKAMQTRSATRSKPFRSATRLVYVETETVMAAHSGATRPIIATPLYNMLWRSEGTKIR